VGSRAALATLYSHGGNAHVLGVTGNPGAGKSTLVSQLITRYRSDGVRVGVVAVDPSSPFTGGAILGDRIRMTEHAADHGVFIRSVASRGALGGISRATHDIVHVLDAMGCGVVIVETLGVGQAEVDIVELAETTLVVVTPGYGDDVQALKAGLLEIADIFVINKAEQEGARTLARHLKTLWELVPSRVEGEWRPPVIQTTARDGTGVDELMAEIGKHSAYASDHPGGVLMESRRLERLVLKLVEQELQTELSALVASPAWETVLDQLRTREQDPYTVATELIGRLLGR
jgi:LAO/AO transport system kinase